MLNYFNYFTEIEERFQQRRGSLLMLSTLDWALIETWREAAVPVAAVLRGIDAAFDKHDAQRQRAGARVRKVNGLAWCAQAVMEAAEQSADAAVGTARREQESGFEAQPVRAYLQHNASRVEQAGLAGPVPVEIVARLRELADELGGNVPLEALDRTLSVLEERLFAALVTAAPEAEMVALKEQAARELAPYKGRMQAVQIKQVQQQFLQKTMLEARKLPRLSLFYMSHG